MSRISRRGVAVIMATLALPVTVGALSAASTGGGDDREIDVAITGDALSRASAAALAETGEGNVTDTEVGDEESYYEVEVRLPDGSEVDVQLDQSFAVVGRSDDESTDGD